MLAKLIPPAEWNSIIDQPTKLTAADHPMNRSLVIRTMKDVLDDKKCKFCLPDKPCALHAVTAESK